ncbi:MAG: glycosyl transferase family 1, partial [Clostridiaceae bacterium]|nr:glycosyl transferase family 1 [Clostridiaceae bacterium]
MNSYIVSLQSNVNDTDRVIYAGRTSKYIASLNDRITSFLSKRNNEEYGLYTYSLLGFDVSKIEEIRKSDVIYLHWVQGGFLSLSSIRKILELNKPVVFFMHDMWSITGGCHYSFNCDNYKTRCGNCQVFSNQRDNDLSTRQFDKKQKLYSQF